MAIQIGLALQCRHRPHGLDDSEHPNPKDRNAAMKRTVRYAAVLGASAVLVSSAVAHANPSTPMQIIESSAAQLCGAINDNPTPDGVMDGVDGLSNRGFDDLDGALVLISAIHHVCPQHEALVMGMLEAVANEEACDKGLGAAVPHQHVTSRVGG